MRKLIYTLFLLIGTLTGQAQSETKESLAPEATSTNVKDFGGFILDMGTMMNAESLVVPLTLPSLNYLVPVNELFIYQLNPNAFKINPNITYKGGNIFTSSHTSMMSLLYPVSGSGMMNWQGTSYKLRNGVRINLYGEYDADGHKVYNPSALPWQRNNFNAAFEVKSANGNFGIKVEVHSGRNNPY